MTGDAQPLIVLHQVTQRYGAQTILDQVSLSFKSGERVALIGPSGAGKTTLLHLLNGSLLPSSGWVTLWGTDTAKASRTKLRQVQRQIGVVYQHLHLVEGMRVLHNVNAGKLGKWSVWQALLALAFNKNSDEVFELLELLGMPDKLHEITGNLSGGEQQRVALARVLAQSPEIILADEPTSSVDQAFEQRMMTLLSQQATTLGKTLIFTSHHVAHVTDYCSRVIGLRAGKIAFDIEASQLSTVMVTDLYDQER